MTKTIGEKENKCCQTLLTITLSVLVYCNLFHTVVIFILTEICLNKLQHPSGLSLCMICFHTIRSKEHRRRPCGTSFLRTFINPARNSWNNTKYIKFDTRKPRFRSLPKGAISRIERIEYNKITTKQLLNVKET